MYFIDLSPYQYKLAKPVKNIKNVGWLDKNIAFNTGRVPEEIFEKLLALMVGSEGLDAHFNRIRGVTPCRICGVRDFEINCSGRSKILGMSEILIPSQDFSYYFASPAWIFHYIKDHSYLPPPAFIKAIEAFDLSRHFIAEDIFDEIMDGE